MPKDPRKPNKPFIRDIYDPDDETKKVIRMVYDRKRQMEDSDDRSQFMNNLDRWEKQYEGYREPRGVDNWQSNHVVPLTHSVVQTALSEIIRQNLQPFIKRRGLEDEIKARIMQHAYDYAWQVSDSDLTLYDVVAELLVSGCAISQEYYRADHRKIGEITINDKGEEIVKEKDVLDYDDVCSEIVKHQDFFIDEFARGFAGPYAARDCIRRYLMDIEDFHLMYDGGAWDQFKDAKLVKPGGDTAYYEWFRPPQGMNLQNQVEVLHYWNKPKDKFTIVANEVLIRDNPNPYWHKQLPFARAVDIKRVHRFYAKGEPELLESIQDELNTLRRMIIDRNHLDIDKMFLVSNKLGFSDEDMIARPHGMIPTDDTNATKPVEYGDIPRSVELSLKHLEDDGTISTGINPRAQALPQAGTATEAAILKESTLRRIEVKIWLLKKDYLIRIGRLRLSNILQFYSQPKLEKIIGDKESDTFKTQVQQLSDQGKLVQIDGVPHEKQFRQIEIKGKTIEFDQKGKMREVPIQGSSFFELKPDYFMPVSRGGYDLEFGAGSNIEISKPLMQSKILELYDRLAQVALQVPNSYDPVKLGDMVIRDYFDKNPDDYKPDAAPQDQQQQQLEVQIQLASFENQQMLKGNDVPPTPYASAAHTRIHLEYMNSDAFQQLPDPDHTITELFAKHATGELMAQEARGMQGVGAQGQNGQMPPQQPQAAGRTQQTRVGQGMENKPNGMKKPANKLGDVLPGLNSGGNPNV